MPSLFTAAHTFVAALASGMAGFAMARTRLGATTVTALALGGAAGSSANRLALELSPPLSGALRPSAAAIEQTMVEIAR